MRFMVAQPRRLTAPMPLLLFVFSSSTSLLPCAHESLQHRDGVTTSVRHAGGRLQLRAMSSVDVSTVGGKGYPWLLQTGKS